MAVLVLMSQNLALSPVSATAQKREGQKYSLVHSHCVQLTLRPPLQFKHSPNMASTNFSCFLKELNLLLYVFQIILKSYRQGFHNVGGGKIWAGEWNDHGHN